MWERCSIEDVVVVRCCCCCVLLLLLLQLLRWKTAGVQNPKCFRYDTFARTNNTFNRAQREQALLKRKKRTSTPAGLDIVRWLMYDMIWWYQLDYNLLLINILYIQIYQLPNMRCIYQVPTYRYPLYMDTSTYWHHTACALLWAHKAPRSLPPA